MLRTVTMTQEVFSRLLLEQMADLVPGEQIATETRDTLRFVFQTYDLFSTAVASYYLRDAERWAHTTAAVQARLIERALEATSEAEVADASQELGYDIAGSHLAAVLWLDSPRLERRAPEAIEAVVHQLRTAADRPVHIIRWAGPATAHLWLQVDDPTFPDRLDPKLPHADDLHVAVGSVANGVAGFRSSHESALATEKLAQLAGSRVPWLLCHREVRAVTLMLHDLPALQAFVTDTLGDLAAEEPRAAELRSTLHAYLNAGRSVGKAATTLHAHRNTVVYRVRGAEGLLPETTTLDAMELRLALQVCELLGPKLSEG
ncbi:PucR family transcriptional regulator [Enemella evansiae]|uniref:PucR family transcriptional regulator n=1 Tax=Enemella evansiae TaxID=2016499 RepID=UPI002B4C1301|nr:helix-turn-helix domain-containing protein [Enemella evansiae]